MIAYWVIGTLIPALGALAWRRRSTRQERTPQAAGVEALKAWGRARNEAKTARTFRERMRARLVAVPVTRRRAMRAADALAGAE